MVKSQQPDGPAGTAPSAAGVAYDEVPPGAPLEASFDVRVGVPGTGRAPAPVYLPGVPRPPAAAGPPSGALRAAPPAPPAAPGAAAAAAAPAAPAAPADPAHPVGTAPARPRPARGRRAARRPQATGEARAKVVRARRRRRLGGLWPATGVPLLTVAFAAVVIVPAALAVAAFSGDVPFLVGARGPARTPTPAACRVASGMLALAWVGALCGLFRVAVVRRLTPPSVTVDADGVWLGRGRHRLHGLSWTGIAAVDLVAAPPADADALPEVVRDGYARIPYLDLYPVAKAVGDPGTLLGDRVVGAAPAAPWLRGRRYVIELAGPAEETAALGRALDHFAPGKRVSGPPAR